jgi:hypothetical protein
MASLLVDLVDLELGRIADGERGARLEHDSTQRGGRARKAAGVQRAQDVRP